jgi:hypothetical protein
MSLQLTVCVMPLRGTGGRDKTTPLWQNELEAKETACLHLAAGTGENAHTVPEGDSPTTMAPAYVAGVRVRQRSREAGLCWAESYHGGILNH